MTEGDDRQGRVAALKRVLAVAEVNLTISAADVDLRPSDVEELRAIIGEVELAACAEGHGVVSDETEYVREVWKKALRRSKWVPPRDALLRDTAMAALAVIEEAPNGHAHTYGVHTPKHCALCDVLEAYRAAVHAHRKRAQ